MITVYIDSGPGRNLKGYTETNKPRRVLRQSRQSFPSNGQEPLVAILIHPTIGVT
jgi:hypothetical protein